MRKATILLLSLCTIVSANVVQAAEKPNVIVIMADDIGAEGLNCYDGTLYTTPRLDQMAAEGARFQNAYATPLCTPTRVTGAPVGFADRDEVSDILDKCKPSEYGVRTLIHEIIQSPLFLRK